MDEVVLLTARANEVAGRGLSGLDEHWFEDGRCECCKQTNGVPLSSLYKTEIHKNCFGGGGSEDIGWRLVDVLAQTTDGTLTVEPQAQRRVCASHRCRGSITVFWDAVHDCAASGYWKVVALAFATAKSQCHRLDQDVQESGRWLARPGVGGGICASWASPCNTGVKPPAVTIASVVDEILRDQREMMPLVAGEGFDVTGSLWCEACSVPSRCCARDLLKDEVVKSFGCAGCHFHPECETIKVHSIEDRKHNNAERPAVPELKRVMQKEMSPMKPTVRMPLLWLSFGQEFENETSKMAKEEGLLCGTA
eukprot:Skav229559  [mRNA]  locus=scaffold568:453416:465086:+ [translate_table: standard]